MSGRALGIIGPFVLIALVAIGFLKWDPLSTFNNGAPPVEGLTIEQVVIDQDGLRLRVRAEGSQALSVAQVQVDGAYWRFSQTPPGPLERLRTAWITIPYPWVQGESHHIVLLSNTGTAFEHTIDVAVPTPILDVGTLRVYGLIGLFVGVVPIVLGMLFFPAMRSAGPETMAFVLALTMGLLGFLFIDTLFEAQEIAEEAAGSLSVGELVWLITVTVAAGLFMVGRRLGGGMNASLLAWSIALGIGLHNFGEGLAIGGAFATGAAALGSFLVIGFTLHNITEGVGIVAPLTGQRPSLVLLGGLAGLAGLPAVLGLWLGAHAFNAHWAALALAVGAGAILQVLVEIGLLIRRRYFVDTAAQPIAGVLSGGVLGLVLMYATSLIVTA